MKRILALLKARNLEFIRDKGALSWNFLFPVLIIIGISFAFNGDRPLFQIGYFGDELTLKSEFSDIHQWPDIQLIKVDDFDKALLKLEQHQYHLLLNLSDKPSYWVNHLSTQGRFLDSLLDGKTSLVRNELSVKKLRYVDWLLPGILAINMMYGALYGVGYVIVRYRKNGYLKRLQATPLTSFEFLTAQLLSRLIISQLVVSLLFAGCSFVLNLGFHANLWLLFLLSVFGAFALSSLGLVLCSRVMSEELSRGLLEVAAWPMLLLSQAWFSMDQAHPILQAISKLLPLTYIIDGWRDVLYYGATFSDIKDNLIYLAMIGFACLLIGSKLFKWHGSQ